MSNTSSARTATEGAPTVEPEKHDAVEPLLPLEGILVLDLGRVLAGPSCTQLLGDYGADVLRIEDMKGDETRLWPPVVGGEGCNYQSVNRNKRGMALDLKTKEGQDILQALARKADVLLHSYLPDVAARLGMDAEKLNKLNPDLIVCCVSGYGASGPMAAKPGYDLMMQAYTGVMELTGDPDGPPMRAGFSTIDLSTGLLAFSGILLALLSRASGRTRGQTVNVSLFETALQLLGYHLTNYAIGGRQPRREGSGVGHLCPYQAFSCTNGWLLAGATNNAVWLRMATAIGYPEWGAEPRFKENQDRVNNRQELISLLKGVFATQSREHWLSKLEEAKVPTAPIRTIVDLFDDPQSAATSMLLRLHNRDGRDITLVGAPIKLSGSKVKVRHLPPLHGEHTSEILREKLSMSDARIKELQYSKAILG